MPVGDCLWLKPVIKAYGLRAIASFAMSLIGLNERLNQASRIPKAREELMDSDAGSLARE